MNIPHYIHISEGCFLEDLLQGPQELDHLRLHSFSVRSKADVLHLVHGGAWNLRNFTESTIVYS